MKDVSTMITKKRNVTDFLVGVLLFFSMILRLVYVQLYLTDDLTAKAIELWSRDIVFTPNRGDILDRNGDVIVGSVSASSVMVVPSQIPDKDNTAKLFS